MTATFNSFLYFLYTNFSDSRLVIETLEPLPQDRKCFRMVNGVLVERTIRDVIPSLKTNSDGLKQVLDELLKQYKAKQTEMDAWKVSWPPV
jgi:prefoldin subunit 2